MLQRLREACSSPDNIDKLEQSAPEA
jgi:hypothetical protein